MSSEERLYVIGDSERVLLRAQIIDILSVMEEKLDEVKIAHTQLRFP